MFCAWPILINRCTSPSPNVVSSTPFSFNSARACVTVLAVIVSPASVRFGLAQSLLASAWACADELDSTGAASETAGAEEDSGATSLELDEEDDEEELDDSLEVSFFATYA